MGCDIHSKVEVRRERYTHPGQQWRGTRWLTLEEEIFTNPWYDADSTYGPFRERYTCQPLGDRNYTLFALLADVRNGRGFAGVVTGNPIIPLSEPRGVPDDASHGWQEYVEQWDVDLHSHTWFTLAELLKPNPLYDQPLIRRGIITGLAYEELKKKGGRPEEWSGGIHGNKILTVTVDEYEAGIRAEEYTPEEIEEMKELWLRAGSDRGETVESVNRRLTKYLAEGRTYVEYVWEDNLRESTQALHTMIAELKRYADGFPPPGKTDHDGNVIDNTADWYGHGGIDYADIRVMIGFDN